MSTRLTADYGLGGSIAGVWIGQPFLEKIDAGGLGRVYPIQQSHVLANVIAQNDHRQGLG